MISAHNNMSDVFDNLVISLCKFTTLLSASEVRHNNVSPFLFLHRSKLVVSNDQLGIKELWALVGGGGREWS